jgi:hypothetical protein
VLLVLMLNVVSTGCAAVQLVASVRRSMLVAAAALAGSLGLCQSAEWVVVRARLPGFGTGRRCLLITDWAKV